MSIIFFHQREEAERGQSTHSTPGTGADRKSELAGRELVRHISHAQRGKTGDTPPTNFGLVVVVYVETHP